MDARRRREICEMRSGNLRTPQASASVAPAAPAPLMVTSSSASALQSPSSHALSLPTPNRPTIALTAILLISIILYASDVFSLSRRFGSSSIHPSDFVISQLAAATLFTLVARRIDSPNAQKRAPSAATTQSKRGKLAGAVHAVTALATASCLANWGVVNTLVVKAIADPFVLLLVHHTLLPPSRFPQLVPRFYSVCALVAFAMLLALFAASVAHVHVLDMIHQMPYLALAVIMPPLRDILLHTQFSTPATTTTSASPPSITSSQSSSSLAKMTKVNSITDIPSTSATTATTTTTTTNNNNNSNNNHATITGTFTSQQQQQPPSNVLLASSAHDATFHTLTINALPWSLVFTLFFRLNAFSDSASPLVPLSAIFPLLRAGVYASALQYASIGLLLTHAPFVHAATHAFLRLPAIVVLLPLSPSSWSLHAVGLVVLALCATAGFYVAQTVRRPPVVSLRIKRLFLLGGLAIMALIVFYGGSVSVAHGVSHRRKNRAARKSQMDDISLVHRIRSNGEHWNKRGRYPTTSQSEQHSGDTTSSDHPGPGHRIAYLEHASRSISTSDLKSSESHPGERENNDNEANEAKSLTLNPANSLHEQKISDSPVRVHEHSENKHTIRMNEPDRPISHTHDKEIAEGTPPGAFFHILEHFYHPSSITNLTLESYQQAERDIPQSFVDTLWQYAATARIATFAPGRTRTCGIEYSAETCVARARVRASAAHVVVHLPLAEYLTRAHITYIDRVREFARDEHVARVIVTGLGAPLKTLPTNLSSSHILREGDLVTLSKTESIFELDPVVVAAVRKLEGLPVDLLVRGDITERLVKNAGFKNSISAGCPTLWLSDDVHLGKTWEQAISALPTHSTKDTKVAVSMRAFKGYVRLMRAIHERYKSRVTFIAQTAWDLGNLRKIGVPLEQVRVPAGAEQWMDVLREVDVVLAGRVQVALMAGAVGTPALAVAPDLSSVELARKVMVPFVTTVDAPIATSRSDNEVDLVKMIRKHAVDGDKFDKNRCELAKAYSRVYERIGLEVMAHIKAVTILC